MPKHPHADLEIHVYCPKCRRPMVPRQSDGAWFYSCTGYPVDCRKTITIERGLALHRCRKQRNSKTKKRSKNKKRMDWRAEIQQAETALAKARQ